MNFLIQHLEVAWKKRASLREEFFFSKSNAYRLLSGADETAPGIIVEQYGPVLLFQIWPDDFGFSDADVKAAGEWLMALTGAKSLYCKKFEKDRSGKPPDEKLYDDKPLLGAVSAEAFEVSENGVRFEVRPFSGYMTGLFMDQRENRRWIASQANGKSLLNLFAYSCTFSVAAAFYGAKSTTNVDLSGKYLTMGKRNFEINAIPLTEHRFFADDCRDFLRRQQKREERYDIVVLDPPSFSRNVKKVFRLEEEVQNLVTAASALVAPQGHFFFSCNLKGWEEPEFIALLRESLPNVSWEKLPAIKKPVDFAADRLMKSALFRRRD